MSDRRVITLVPKAGMGLATTQSRHNLGTLIESFADYRDILVADGNWRVRLGNLISPFPTGTGAIWGTHFFNSIDTTGATAAPTTVVLYVAGPNAGTVNLNYLTASGANGTITTVAAPYELCFLTIKNRCMIAGRNFTPLIVTEYPTRTSYGWGKAGGSTDLAYTPYTNVTNSTTKIVFRAGDISGGAGTNAWTSAGSHFDNSGAWDGKTLIVEGITYTINTVTTTGALTTTTPKVLAVVAKDFKVQYGSLSWTFLPPKYAYAYYAPSTGHITNMGPVLTLSEKNMSNVNVELLAIPGTNDPVYTRIVIFRTGEDGGDLFPLKLDAAHGGTATINTTDEQAGMIENTYVGTRTYVDYQPPQKLGAVLGLVVHTQTNNPPPDGGMRYTAYWDGRVWFVDPTRPWELGYTGSPTQNPLGVPEECFPARNRIPIASDDGFITALRVVGGSLLVGSAQYLYTVTGSVEGQYGLKRISSRAVNVGHWAIDEHPGDTTSESASVIYIGADRRLWQQLPGGKLIDIGRPIQNQINSVPLDASRPFFVKVGQCEKSWFVAFGFINAAKTKYSFLFYDLDNQQWYDWRFKEEVQPGWSISYGTSYPSGYNMFLWGSNTSARFTTFGEINFVGPAENALMQTQHMDCGDPLAKKVLEDIVLFVDDADAAFTTRIAFDGDDASAGTSLTFVPVTNSPRYPGTGIMQFAPSTRLELTGRQFRTIQLFIEIPSTGNSVLHYVSKIQFVVKLFSSGIGGSPS